MKNKIRILSQIVIFTILAGCAGLGSTDVSAFPDRIILNPSADPAHEQAVTWRSSTEIKKPVVQVSMARRGVNLENFAKDIPAATEKVNIPGTGTTVWHHSAVIKELDPGTGYYYRVGSNKAWSEWIAFKTAEKSFEPFTFVYMGDPQLGLRSYCSRLFRQAIKSAPDARFWLFAGDLVNDGDSDTDFRDLFYAGSWMFRSVNVIPVAGNHEYPAIDGRRQLTPLWRPHYTLPENGPAGLEESSYWLDYQGVRIIVLNGNEKLEEQRDWLKKVLKDNNSRWTIASIHQPMYSTGHKLRDNPELREQFLDLFDKYGVDLVLQGHDHTYGRTFPLRKGEIATGYDKGTIYVVSSSGSKFYEQNPRYLDVMAKTALGTQLFQVLDVDEYTLKYKAVTANGNVIDEFTVIKE